MFKYSHDKSERDSHVDCNSDDNYGSQLLVIYYLIMHCAIIFTYLVYTCKHLYDPNITINSIYRWEKTENKFLISQS